MPSGSAVIGAIGLAGEVRPVSHFDDRIKEITVIKYTFPTTLATRQKPMSAQF